MPFILRLLILHLFMCYGFAATFIDKYIHPIWNKYWKIFLLRETFTSRIQIRLWAKCVFFWKSVKTAFHKCLLLRFYPYSSSCNCLTVSAVQSPINAAAVWQWTKPDKAWLMGLWLRFWPQWQVGFSWRIGPRFIWKALSSAERYADPSEV